MAAVTLHGALADFHPEPLRLHVKSPAEAVRALLANFEGIGEVIRAGNWHVIRGDLEAGMSLDKDELTIGLGPDTELHLIPAVEGSGRGGAVKTILGVVIMVVAVAAAVYTGGGSLAAGMSAAGWSGGLVSIGNVFMFGAAMTLSGIAQMMAPTPKLQSLESADNAKSYIFAGPTNRMEQGNPVPVVYGRCRVGSVVIAASITNEDLALDSSSATGEAAMPKVTPESAVATTVFDAQGNASSPHVQFTVETALADVKSYRATGVTGGALVSVFNGVELPLGENGAVIGYTPNTLRFKPSLTDLEIRHHDAGHDGANSTVEATRRALGGSFTLIGTNELGQPVGQPRTVYVTGWTGQLADGTWVGGNSSNEAGDGNSGDNGAAGNGL